MGLKEKIAPYVILLSTLTPNLSCATNNVVQKQDVKEIPLVVQDNTIMLTDGYQTTEYANDILKNIAGIYTGTVEITKTEQGYETFGYFSKYLHPDIFLEVLKEADVNNDKFVTDEEANNLLNKVYQEQDQ